MWRQIAAYQHILFYHKNYYLLSLFGRMWETNAELTLLQVFLFTYSYFSHGTDRCIQLKIKKFATLCSNRWSFRRANFATSIPWIRRLLARGTQQGWTTGSGALVTREAAATTGQIPFAFLTRLAYWVDQIAWRETKQLFFAVGAWCTAWLVCNLTWATIRIFSDATRFCTLELKRVKVCSLGFNIMR